MYNRVILMGRITHDLELRTTPNGINVCDFQLAVDRPFQNKGEERKSDFFRVVAWRQSADFVCRYFGKGKMILVEGTLQTNQYTDKNGVNVTRYEIVADRLSFTGEKAQGGSYSQTYGGNNYAPAPQQYSAPAQEYRSAPAPAPAPAPAGDFSASQSDDGYPF